MKKTPPPEELIEQVRKVMPRDVGEVFASVGIDLKYLGASCFEVVRKRADTQSDTGHRIIVAFDEETGEFEGFFTRA